VIARRLDDDSRVHVFIDGQNLYKSTFELFGSPHCHPILIARELADNRKLVGVTYYSGIHDPHVNPQLNARLQRRHALMRRTRVTVVERPLRYRMQWGFRQADLPDPRTYQGPPLTIEVTAHQKAREKGIDVALALDLVDLALSDQIDVAIVVSGDTDLCEVARVVHQLTRRLNRVSVEAAVWKKKRTILLSDYDYTHNMERSVFNRSVDDFDYRSEIDGDAAEEFISNCRMTAKPGCV